MQAFLLFNCSHLLLQLQLLEWVAMLLAEINIRLNVVYCFTGLVVKKKLLKPESFCIRSSFNPIQVLIIPVWGKDVLLRRLQMNYISWSKIILSNKTMHAKWFKKKKRYHKQSPNTIAGAKHTYTNWDKNKWDFYWNTVQW